MKFLYKIWLNDGRRPKGDLHGQGVLTRSVKISICKKIKNNVMIIYNIRGVLLERNQLSS